MKKSLAVYPGSFDPVTYGHIDVIKRAAGIFDELIVAVAHNIEKTAMFSAQERMGLLKKSVKPLKNVAVDDFDGLAVEYAKSQGTRIMIRGLRMISDFEYEFQMALMNRKLAPSVETVFMMPNEVHSYLSSKLIKEIIALGGDAKNFVPPFVEKAIKSRCKFTDNVNTEAKSIWHK